MKNEGERLAVLEAGMIDVKKGLDDVRADIKVMTKSVDALISARLSEQVDSRAKIQALQAELINVKLEMQDIKNANSPMKTWLRNSAAAVLGSVMTFLVIEYLKNSGR